MGVRWILEQASRVQKVALDFFNIDFFFAALGGGATVQVTQPTPSDADFALYQISGASYSAVAVNVPLPNILISIVDQSSGRALQNAPVHWITTVGTAQLPFVLPEAKFFNGNGGIAITLTDVSAVASVCHVTLSGVKVFYKGGATRASLMQNMF